MTNETDRVKRSATFTRVLDMMRPWLGRIVAEWHDKQKNAIYVFLICSKEADADHPDGNRHTWRGTVTVNITHDGSAYFSIDEYLVRAAIKSWSEMGSLPVHDWEQVGTWEMTEQLLSILTPPLPKEKLAA